MIEADFSPIHALPSGLCEDKTGEVASLIGRMAKGDGGALAVLHGMWSPVLLGISCRMLGDQREAEKVVMETFVQIWRRAAEFTSHQPPFVWAFTLMRALCIERIRHRRKRDASRAVSGFPPMPAEKSEDPRVMPLDDWRRVKAALDQLAPDELSGLEHAVLLGYMHPDAPEQPGTPPGAVKNRLRQALDKVRTHLSRYEL